MNIHTTDGGSNGHGIKLEFDDFNMLYNYLWMHRSNHHIRFWCRDKDGEFIPISVDEAFEELLKKQNPKSPI